MDCSHEHTKWIGDTPIANPETLEFEGRFDTLECVDCHTILERAEVGTKVTFS